ncbi:hypothetical protein Tco_0519012 [Tanacetum coccineum]
MALISLSFKKIYKPTNKNLRTSSNSNRANQDNTSRINKGTGYDNHRVVNVIGASKEWLEIKKGKRIVAYIIRRRGSYELKHIICTCHKYQEVTSNALDISVPIIDARALQKDDNDDLAKEGELLASLIEKLKCEIDDNKNRNKLLESSNKILVDNLTSQIEDFQNTNKSLESANTHFKEANNGLSKTNQLMFKDLKKFRDELEKRHDVNYMSTVELECCYNDNLALMLVPESDEMIRFAQESRSKLRVIPTTSVSKPHLKSNQLEDRVMSNNSQGKKQDVEDHRPLLEPALNLIVHCCGLEFRVLNGYDQKSFDEERGLN